MLSLRSEVNRSYSAFDIRLVRFDASSLRMRLGSAGGLPEELDGAVVDAPFAVEVEAETAAPPPFSNCRNDRTALDRRFASCYGINV